MKERCNRMDEKVAGRLKMMITKYELRNKNLIKVTNNNFIPAKVYQMNVHKCALLKLVQLHQVIKQELRKKKTFGRQSIEEKRNQKLTWRRFSILKANGSVKDKAISTMY